MTTRIGVTGLARAGKTAFLTSVAANMLALGAGVPVLPALQAGIGARSFRATLANAGAESLPRFALSANMAALAKDPPVWPERTGSVSLLAMDLEIGREGLASILPARDLRVEFLDYPGEWLLDLPLLGQDFATWSHQALRQLEGIPAAAAFLSFLNALPSGAARESKHDETVAATGHRLYHDLLHRLRDSEGWRFLQPGRFLMPAPGPQPPWIEFFPARNNGGLGALLRERYDAYREDLRRQLISPLFGQVDRLVVLADVLSALHDGPGAYRDTEAGLRAASGALRWQNAWIDWVPAPLRGWLPPFLAGGISRVAFVATKADHVAQRQRGNLLALMQALTMAGHGVQADHRRSVHAIASVRCTEDFVWTLDGRNISAVRGRVIGDARMTRSYPGEVPDSPPDDAFWAHPFLELPQFEPLRLPGEGRAGIPNIGLDGLLAFLLEDVL